MNETEFNSTFKGNCGHRMDHLCLHDMGEPDYCDMEGCPRLPHLYCNDEVALSQCDKCGSEVPEDEIDWDMRYYSVDTIKAWILGVVSGIIVTTIAAIVIL